MLFNYIIELYFVCILCFSVKSILEQVASRHSAFLGFCLVQPLASMPLWVLTALPPQVGDMPHLVITYSLWVGESR